MTPALTLLVAAALGLGISGSLLWNERGEQPTLYALLPLVVLAAFAAIVAVGPITVGDRAARRPRADRSAARAREDVPFECVKLLWVMSAAFRCRGRARACSWSRRARRCRASSGASSRSGSADKCSGACRFRSCCSSGSCCSQARRFTSGPRISFRARGRGSHRSPSRHCRCAASRGSRTGSRWSRRSRARRRSRVACSASRRRRRSSSARSRCCGSAVPSGASARSRACTAGSHSRGSRPSTRPIGRLHPRPGCSRRGRAISCSRSPAPPCSRA